jgi:hypothetical protein
VYNGLSAFSHQPGKIMRLYLPILLIFILSACTAPPQSKVVVPREAISSAVINLNIASREASIGTLASDSANLFEAEVSDVNSVEFAAEIADQAFIALSDSSPDETPWTIAVHPSVPSAFVVDLSDGSLNADLSTLTIPLFDMVSSDSSLELILPTSASQLALDASDSTVNLNIPTGSSLQLNQFVSSGSFITMNTAEGVGFDGAMTIAAGGLTLQVPLTTGVQVIVEAAQQSEVSLPNMERIGAEIMTYQTENFTTATSLIVLRVSLNGAAIRVEQE